MHQQMTEGRLVIHRPDMAEPVREAPPGAGVVSADPALPQPGRFATALLRRVNSYRRAGGLVGLRAFLARRDRCRGCALARRRVTHPGLYGCGACTTCTGGPERLLQVSSTCQRGLWPV